MWISQQELIVKTRESTATWRKRRQRYRNGLSEQFEYKEEQGAFYYKLESLPRSIKTLLEAKSEPLTLVGFERFLKDYKLLPIQKAERLAKAAYTLAMIKERGVDLGSAIEFIQLNDIALPTSKKRLLEKINAIESAEQAAEIVKLPRQFNKNAEKFIDLELKAWIILLREHGRNFTNAFITRKCQVLCEMAEKPVPSASWFERYLASNEVKEMTLARYGSARRANWATAYLPMERPLFASDTWQMDGTRINFIEFDNEKGGKNFLYAVFVRDVNSGAIIGFDFGVTENRYMYINALRMAARFANGLPQTLVLDKFPGHNTPEWKFLEEKMKVLGTTTHYTPKAQGKAQIERFIQTLQTVFMQDSAYYYGEGVQASRDYSHRSPEYLKFLRKETKTGWTFNESADEFLKVLEAYNTTKYSVYSRKYKYLRDSPMTIFKSCQKLNAVVVTEIEVIQLFGLKTKARHRGGLIKIEIQGIEHHFWIENEALILEYKEFEIRYDMENLQTIHLFADDKYLGIANAQAAVLYSDYKAIAKAKANQKRFEDARKTRRDEIVGNVDESGLLLGGFAQKRNIEAAESYFLLSQNYEDTGGGVWATDEPPMARDILDDL